MFTGKDVAAYTNHIIEQISTPWRFWISKKLDHKGDNIRGRIANRAKGSFFTEHMLHRLILHSFIGRSQFSDSLWDILKIILAVPPNMIAHIFPVNLIQTFKHKL